ncbi:hypothetical protein DXM25_11840 [Agrobacterium rosae]|nr:hypothetical protein DXM25_11840 [Agrobacterium rosae]MQB48829.1 hypothetical protein [Agrobacterium rosae]
MENRQNHQKIAISLFLNGIFVHENSEGEPNLASYLHFSKFFYSKRLPIWHDTCILVAERKDRFNGRSGEIFSHEKDRSDH